MGSAEARKNAQRLMIEGFNAGNIAVLDDLLAEDYADHDLPPGTPPGLEAFKSTIADLRAAFPDLKYTIEDELADNDKAMMRVTASGTMQGDFQGMKASGKSATWQEMHLTRFDANGRMVEHWGITDQLGMLMQLGFLPRS